MRSYIWLILLALMANMRNGVGKDILEAEEVQTEHQSDKLEDLDPTNYANDCEVCRIVGAELTLLFEEIDSLDEVGRAFYLLQMSKGLTEGDVKLKWTTGAVCNNLLTYTYNRNRTDVHRFVRTTVIQSHSVYVKGDEITDTFCPEIIDLKYKCDSLIANHHMDIEEWYYHYQYSHHITDILCVKAALHLKDISCLRSDDTIKMTPIKPPPQKTP